MFNPSIEVGRFWVCDVTWRNVCLEILHEHDDDTLWMHPKGANIMAASGLGCRRKALVGTGWAISLLLCMYGIRKHTFGLVGPPFLTMSLCFSVCMVSHWLRAVYIENLLLSECGLSHESAENDCKGSWVKFWALKLNWRELGMLYLKGPHKLKTFVIYRTWNSHVSLPAKFAQY